MTIKAPRSSSKSSEAWSKYSCPAGRCGSMTLETLITDQSSLVFYEDNRTLKSLKVG